MKLRSAAGAVFYCLFAGAIAVTTMSSAKGDPQASASPSPSGAASTGATPSPAPSARLKVGFDRSLTPESPEPETTIAGFTTNRNTIVADTTKLTIDKSGLTFHYHISQAKQTADKASFQAHSGPIVFTYSILKSGTRPRTLANATASSTRRTDSAEFAGSIQAEDLTPGIIVGDTTATDQSTLSARSAFSKAPTGSKSVSLKQQAWATFIISGSSGNFVYVQVNGGGSCFLSGRFSQLAKDNTDNAKCVADVKITSDDPASPPPTSSSCDEPQEERFPDVAPSNSPKQNARATRSLSGCVTIPYDVLIRFFDSENDHPARQVLHELTVFASLDSQVQGNPMPGAMPGKACSDCKAVVDLYIDPDNVTHFSGKLGASTAATAAPATGTSRPQNDIPISITAVQPSNRIFRASTSIKTDLDLSFLNAQSTQYINSALSQQNGSFNLQDLCKTSSCVSASGSDAFDNIDIDSFVAARSPLRPDLLTKTGELETDLKPIDFTKIGDINYGGKAVVQDPERDDRAAIMWFRTIDPGSSGSAMHAEYALFGGGLDAAVTDAVVSNVGPPQKNLYIPGLLHSDNLVSSLTGQEGIFFQTLFRYGSSLGSHDIVAIQSFSDDTRTDRTQDHYWTPRGEVGYRQIDFGYTPLGTAYDPFVGSRSTFFAIGAAERDVTRQNLNFLDISADGVRAVDAYGVRYWDAALVIKSPVGPAFGNSTFGADFTYDNSALSASTASRIDPSVVAIPLGSGTNMIANNAINGHLTYKLGQDVNNPIVSAKAGLDWHDSPLCKLTKAPFCTATYKRNVTGSFTLTLSPVSVDFNVGPAKDVQDIAGQKSVPSNQIATTGLMTWDVTRCTNLIASYSNNSSDTSTRAFALGYNFQGELDQAVGPGAIKLQYKRVFDINLHLLPASSRAIAASFVLGANDKSLKSLTDRCKAKAPASKSGSDSDSK